MDQPTQTPAGWYPDPWVSGQQRYWDGQQWTAHTNSPQPQPPQPQPQPEPTSAGQFTYTGSTGAGGFSDYQQVPFFRRQWFFWLTYIIFAPIALGILITGDVYYMKGSQIRSFGTANRVVAGIIALIWLSKVAQFVTAA